jgi:hypothetical protein
VAAHSQVFRRLGGNSEAVTQGALKFAREDAPEMISQEFPSFLQFFEMRRQLIDELIFTRFVANNLILKIRSEGVNCLIDVRI